MFQFSQGIYFSRAADHELVTVVRSGDPLPDGPGTFGSFNTNPAINASGSLAFRSVNLHDTPGGAMDNAGVFLSDGRVITTIARRGALTPTGDGLLFEFPLEVLCLNDSGQVLFTASLAGTDGGSTDDSGLFLGDGTSLVEIAREGDPAPGGGAFTSFAALFGIPMALNNAGEVVFLCTLSGGVQAIMRWTHDEGLAVVVREGDVTPTGAIIALDFAGHADQFATPGSGLNDAGQIAFWFRTTGFSTGIGRWPAMLVGDLNGDGIVDGADLGQLLAAWGDVESMPEADLNEDGVINGADLGLLLAAWTG